MNMSIFCFLVFSSQFNLNNTDGEDTNMITPIIITSTDKIINTFILMTGYIKFFKSPIIIRPWC